MSGSEEEKVHRTVERVERESYGRLAGDLSAPLDVAVAKYALREAF